MPPPDPVAGVPLDEPAALPPHSARAADPGFCSGAASADGSTIGDVAVRLHLSEGTVRNYLSAAIRKTSARNRIEAVQAAQRQGWL